MLSFWPSLTTNSTVLTTSDGFPGSENVFSYVTDSTTRANSSTVAGPERTSCPSE